MKMCASVKIAATFLLISYITAVPVHDKSEDNGDLKADSSEIISEAVAPPKRPNSHSDHSIEIIGDSQNFFPSFANLFEPRQDNYKFGFGNQEAAFSQRPNSYRSLLNYPLFGGYRALDSFAKQSTPSEPLVDASSSVLGSGNFGIIKGGTFSAQNDEDDYDGYYYNNGHGRPMSVGYIANPRPNYNHDQFANFKDFADINTPSNSAYSHFVVVYANKNATMDEVSEETRQVLSKPKNIIETLEQLDSAPTKISKSKAKLAATKHKYEAKKNHWKNAKTHDDEPLLALS